MTISTEQKVWTDESFMALSKDGHDWQLTEAQREQLQQYYDANKLLVDCLNSDCYVAKATRQEIEDTLLLPMGKIK